MSTEVPMTFAHDDGLGLEIMAAPLQVLPQGGAALGIETLDIGEKVYLRGNAACTRGE